jgi:hypothetical protein
MTHPVATGTLTVTVNGTTETSSLALSSGEATYTFSATAAGTYVIEAVYSGDNYYAGSSGTVTVSVGSTAESFSVTATSVTVAAGSSGTSTVTVTPAGGYTGTVDWTVAVNAASSVLANACFSIADTAVSGSSPVSTTLTIYTSSGACSGATSGAVPGKVKALGRVAVSPESELPFTPVRGAVLLSGLIGAWVFGRKSRTVRLLMCLLVLGSVAGAVSGCGSGGSTSSGGGTDAAKGTYSMTITGTDSANSAITASGGFTLVID